MRRITSPPKLAPLSSLYKSTDPQSHIPAPNPKPELHVTNGSIRLNPEIPRQFRHVSAHHPTWKPPHQYNTSEDASLVTLIFDVISVALFSGVRVMAVKKACESFSKEVQRWGCMKQTGVSLRYMMEFGSEPSLRNLLISAQFLHKELPIRIARRAIELESLPYGLSDKPAVLKVRDWYLDSFRDLRSFPDIKDDNDEKDFTQMIKAIKVRHNNVVPMMALGVQQLKKGINPKIIYEDRDEIHQFLDRFYMSRIGIRMLIGQHVELHNPNPPPHCVGYIHTKMSPLEVAQNASEDARSICFREYGSAPNINIYGDPDFTFPYVPTHLHLMVFELVKNSLRAVQERFMDSDKVAPPVRIIVADGIEDVTIKVSDEGGGIPRSGLPKIFTYLYSTAVNRVDEQTDLGTTDSVTMAGYGYGLPISRLYARYFGGDLQIISMEGYGTDAYLHLSRLGDSQEPLP